MTPARLGDCRILETLASGPVTRTYRALHEPLHRRVTIKALAPTLAPTSPLAAELAREGRILALLGHDAIVTLLQVVEDEAGVYLMLEDLDGPTLLEVLSRIGRLELLVALAVGHDVARALGHAHERGVAHRRLEPACVHLLRDGRCKLGGFGFAHHERVASSPELLQGGVPFAPVASMAPEQILGEPGDGRADLFALGVLLHRMIAGGSPFGGEEGAGGAHRVRHAPASPLRRLVPETPRAVEQIVLRCLEKQPADRPASAHAVAVALEETLRGRTLTSREALVRRALSGARFLREAPPPLAARAAALPAPSTRGSLRSTVQGYLVLLALVLLGGAALVFLGSAEGLAPPATVAAGSMTAGQLRVSVYPWAEVWVDGEHVETTPFARPIPLAPGRHHVVLRHPRAPVESRAVRVGPGEVVHLDVTMRLAPPPSDAGSRDAARDVEPPTP